MRLRGEIGKPLHNDDRGVYTKARTNDTRCDEIIALVQEDGSVHELYRKLPTTPCSVAFAPEGIVILEQLRYRRERELSEFRVRLVSYEGDLLQERNFAANIKAGFRGLMPTLRYESPQAVRMRCVAGNGEKDLIVDNLSYDVGRNTLEIREGNCVEVDVTNGRVGTTPITRRTIDGQETYMVGDRSGSYTAFGAQRAKGFIYFETLRRDMHAVVVDRANQRVECIRTLPSSRVHFIDRLTLLVDGEHGSLPRFAEIRYS